MTYALILLYSLCVPLCALLAISVLMGYWLFVCVVGWLRYTFYTIKSENHSSVLKPDFNGFTFNVYKFEVSLLIPNWLVIDQYL